MSIITFLKGPRVYSEPPDGGWGWFITLGSFLVYITTVGIQYTIGLIYRALLLDTEFTRGWSRSDLAWVVSIETSCFLGGQLLSGYIVNSQGVRVAVWLGTLLLVLGFGLSAIVTSPGYLYLTYGILTGLGCALPSAATIVSVQRFFKAKRVTATGLAVSGSGFGALTLGPIIEVIISKTSWRTACIFLALLNGILLPIVSLLFIPIELRKPIPDDNDDTRVVVSSSLPVSEPVNNIPAKNLDNRNNFSVDPIVGSSASVTDVKSHSPSVDSSVLFSEGKKDAISQNSSTEIQSLRIDTSVIGNVSTRDEDDATTGGEIVSRVEDENNETIHRSLSTLPKLSTKELLKNRPFLIWIIFVSIYGATWFVVMAHFITFVQERGTSPTDSSLLILAQGIANTVGRAGLGILSDQISVPKLNILQVCVATVGFATAALSVGGDSFAYQIIYMLINGLCGGSIVSLQAPITVDLVGLASLPVAQGLFHMAQAPFVLASPPIAGALRAEMDDYNPVFFINGVFMCISAVLCGFIPRMGKDEELMNKKGSRGQRI